MSKLSKILLSIPVGFIITAASCPPNPPDPCPSGCIPAPQPTPTPTTPPVSQQCVAQGLSCACWDMPPGSGWIYVHCCASCPGGVCSSSGPAVPCGVTPSPTPTPGPTPTPSFCPDPPVWGDPIGKTVKASLRVDMETKINTAMTQLGYSDGQTLVGDCNVKAEEFYEQLQSKVRANGSCAYVGPDAFHIVVPNGTIALDHHMINFGGCRLRFASIENYKGDWLVNPGVPPTPVPSPTPTPPNACRTTQVDSFRNIVKPHSGQQIDFTGVACGGDVVATNNNCLANCCELSAEKGNQACADALIGAGGPVWSAPPSINLIQINETNTYTMKVVSGSGLIRACGKTSGVPGNCVLLQVTPTVPPCTVPPGSNQGCAVSVP